MVERCYFLEMIPAYKCEMSAESVQMVLKQLHSEHDLVKIYFDFAEASKLIEDEDTSCDLDSEETQGEPSGEGCRVDA